MAQAAREEVQLAVFTLMGQPYSIDIMKIKQIIRPLKISRLPKAPDFLEGVINLRGVVIPVIDMRKRFGMPRREEDQETKVIIAAVERKTVGVIVDDVTEIISMPKNRVQPPPRVVKGIESTYLKGVCRHKDEILMILDLDQILSAEEKITLTELSRSAAQKTNREEIK